MMVLCISVTDEHLTVIGGIFDTRVSFGLDCMSFCFGAGSLSPMLLSSAKLFSVFARLRLCVS